MKYVKRQQNPLTLIERLGVVIPVRETDKESSLRKVSYTVPDIGEDKMLAKWIDALAYLYTMREKPVNEGCTTYHSVQTALRTQQPDTLFAVNFLVQHGLVRHAVSEPLALAITQQGIDTVEAMLAMRPAMDRVGRLALGRARRGHDLY
jgi:hypothetical protein